MLTRSLIEQGGSGGEGAENNSILILAEKILLVHLRPQKVHSLVDIDNNIQHNISTWPMAYMYYDITTSASQTKIFLVSLRNFSRHCEKCRWVSVWHQNIGIAIVAESKHPLLQVECVWLLALLAARDCCLLPGLRIVNSLQKFPIKILGISRSQIFGAHQSYHVTYTAPGTPTGYKWLKYEHRNHCQACTVNKHLQFTLWPSKHRNKVE